MKTTTLIGEIVVLGLFALVWIGLALSRVGAIRDDDLALLWGAAKDCGIGITLVGGVLCYQVGWLVNSLSYALATVLAGKRLRQRIFAQAGLDYEATRLAVYQHASADLRHDLGVDRSVVRLARGGVFNLGILGLLLLTDRSFSPVLGVFLLLCSAGSAWQWWYRYRRYYRRMCTAYHVMAVAQPSSASRPETASSG